MEFTVRQIAEKNGCSARVVQKLIRQHPELGIVTEERKRTYLTQHQAAQISALLNQKSAENGSESTAFSHISAYGAESTANKKQKSADLIAETGFISEEVAEMRVLVATLQAQIEAKDALIASKDAEIGRLVDSQAKDRESLERVTSEFASTVKQLETAEAKAERAQAEADSYRPSLFGFYRRK
jgi:chromosome segregation ATPase